MTNKKLLTDSIWSIGSHLGTLLIVLIANIFLARIMSPLEFGQLGIIMFFISVFNVFTDGGMSGALVRKINKTENDYSTVFCFNLIVSIFLFIIVILASSYIAKYYNSPQIQKPIIYSASILLISAFQTIPNVKLLENLEFKIRSILTLVSSIIGVLTGIFLAYFFQLGLWALITIQVVTVSCQTLLFCFYKGLYLRLQFTKKSFKELFGFGVNTTLVSVLNLSFDNIYQLVIGRIFSLTQVGFYYQAKKLQDVPNNLVNNLSQGVFFSTLSKMQEDKSLMLSTYSLISKFFIWIMGFVVLFILLLGDDIILLIFGIKWVGSIFYLKVLIVGSFFYTQELINKMIFKVYNQTHKLLKLEFIKKTFQIITLIYGIYLKNLDILLIGYVITSLFSYFLNYYFTSKILPIGKTELLVLLKVCIIVVALFALINLINRFEEGDITYLAIGVSILLYFILSNWLLDLKYSSFKKVFQSK